MASDFCGIIIKRAKEKERERTMKRAKIFACIISIVMMLSICSCDKKTVEETTEETTSATTQETTSESTTTEETESVEEEEEDDGYDYETVRIDIDEPLLGFEGCYAEGGNMYFDFYDWTFYNADGEMIGNQFGFECESPVYYLMDYDGDGNDDLICPVQYGGDMALRVNIYRNNNGTIEEATLDEDAISNRIGEGLYVQNHSVLFDAENELIIFEYYDGLNDESFPLKPDDFIFYEVGSDEYNPYELEFEGWKTETVVLNSDPLLGFANWYCEKTYDGYGYTYWDFYTEDGVLFAKQFGDIGKERPIIYIKDLDGDGKDELISECYYRDAGETHYFIYKNDNGVIKCGYLPTVHVGEIVNNSGITTWDYYEDYDKKNDRIVVYNFEDSNYYELTIDDFTFEEGDPTSHFGS